MEKDQTSAEKMPAAPADTATSLLDKAITLRQIRKWFVILLVLGLIWYAWEMINLQWHDKMGGIVAKNSPYYDEIPDECKKFSNRHRGFYDFADNKFLRSRPIRLPSSHLQTDYGRVRCLGYAVLTGVHMRDPLDANFVDTYVDEQGDPIVRITVDYLKTYQYDPSQRKELNEEEKR